MSTPPAAATFCCTSWPVALSAVTVGLLLQAARTAIIANGDR